MRNIYEIFESMREYQVEHSYNILEESLNTMDILFEANEENKGKEGLVQRAISFIKEIIKRFGEWINKIIRKNVEDNRDIEELLSSYDFGKIDAALKRAKNNVTVKCHKHLGVMSIELTLTHFPNEVINDINRWRFIDEYKTKSDNTDEILKAVGVKSFEEIKPRIMEELQLTDKHIKEFKLSEILYGKNPVQQLNGLINLNKRLDELKKRVEDMGEKTIKQIEQSEVEVEARLHYFKYGMKVLNALLLAFTEGFAKIKHINESIVRKMISEYNKLPKSKR